MGGFVVVAGWVAGPRVSADPDLTPITAPDDPARWLAERESRFDDIRPGNEALLRWHDPETRARTPLAFVYIHGYTASRQEVAPLVDSLAERFGANVLYARLAGHGRTPDAMRDASLARWTRDVREAIAVGGRIGERVVLVGTSNGGALAAWAAGLDEFEGLLAATVLISPNLGPRDWRGGLLDGPWGLPLTRLIVGDYYVYEARNPRHEAAWTTRSAIEGLPHMTAAVRLARQAADDSLTAPLQVHYSTMDQVVAPERIEEWFAEVRAPRTEAVVYGEIEDPGNHVLAGDILSPSNTAAVLESIAAFLRDGAPDATDS
jgi:alpha-beta hydrolase superfamily lysophospholipase